MSSGWKYGKCARLRCIIIGSTPKSYHIGQFDSDHPEYEDYIPLSQIMLSEATNEGDYMYLWCTLWILEKKGISLAGLPQRNQSDLIAQAYEGEVQPVSEHLTKEDQERMEEELNFEDSVGHRFGVDYHRNQEN
jgi:hypothetical protein